MRRTGLALAGVITGLLAAPTAAAAVTLEPIGTATYEAPTYVTSDPTNPDRLFVTEQDGTIWETTPGGTRLFLELDEETADPNGSEEGLWSMAIPREPFATGRFYVAHSANDHAPEIVRYVEGATPAATEASAQSVLKVEDNPASSNHNGGQLQFGPDGYLYWSLGDDANGANAQDPGTRRGKILRLEPLDVSTPAQIWALGLRNPWRFSFDRLTGAVAIGDVGQGSWEEVNLTSPAPGRNYGWNLCEGFAGSGCSGPAFTPPIYTYANNADTCAITGGYVVRDPDLGDLYGRYLFADFCEGALRSIDPSAAAPERAHRYEGLAVDHPSSFGEDACGRLYVVSRGAGQVFRLEGPSGGACPQAVGDTDPPETSLKLKRKNRRGTRYVARIGSDEPGSTFECRLDRRKWKACGAKRKLRRLDPGRHRFRARATDAAGNTDPQPAKKRFRTRRR